MGMNARWTAAASVIALVVGGALAAPPARAQFFARMVNPKVEVTMTHPPGFPVHLERAAVIPEKGDECAEEFAAAVSERFVDNGIELVDRQNLDAMFQEMDFGLSGRIDPGSAVELGKMLGPTALISVKVQRCAVEPNRLRDKHKTLKGEVYYTYIARMDGWFKATIQVTDLASGRIFKTKTVDASRRMENTDNDGWPAYPSEFEVRDAFMADATGQVHRMFFPWTERKQLYFFDDDECGLKTAYGLMKIGEIDSAASQSEENLEQCKTADVKPKFLARAYYNLGMTRFLQSRFDEALDLLKTAFGIDGGNIISDSIAECRKAQSLAAEMAELDDGGGFEMPSGSEAGQPAVRSASMKPGPGAPAGASARSAAAPGSVTERLEKLKGLFDQGLITKAEYEAKRKEILAEL